MEDKFGVFSKKSKGQFYFVVVMFATENESSKYKFKLVVHDSEKDVESSEMVVRFEGNPVSIDVMQGEVKLYGTCSQFMKKMLSKSNTQNIFCISFEIFKN